MISLLNEISLGYNERRVWARLAGMAIQTQYKQNTLGPFWISINTGVLIAAFSVVYSQILSAPLDQHVLYVATGLVCWYFFSSIVLKGCTAFIVSRQLILQLPMPISVHVFRLLTQELIIFGYNCAVLVIVMILFKREFSWEVLMAIPAFILILICGFFTAFLLAMVATRYRDVTSSVQAVIAPMMFLTPIIWSPESLENRPVFVSFNPFFHLIEIWRAPLIGGPIPAESWLFMLVVTLSMVIACAVLFSKYKNRIVFCL